MSFSSIASEPFASPQAAAPLAASPSASGLLQMLLALAVVLAVIFALAWLVRKMRTMPSAAPSPLRQVAELRIGDKERVVLISAGQQYWLLGVAPGQVALLQAVDESTLPVAAKSTDNGSGAFPGIGSFAAALRRNMGLDR